MSHVYVPIRGGLSIVVQMKNGESAEALSVGSEGFVALPVWLGQKRSIEQVLQRIPGSLVRISSASFCEMIQGNRAAERLLKRFATYSLRAGYQGVMCNAHHNVEQRACRWILTTADRASSVKLTLSQALLAHMLGRAAPDRQSNRKRAAALRSAGVPAHLGDYYAAG